MKLIKILCICLCFVSCKDDGALEDLSVNAPESIILSPEDFALVKIRAAQGDAKDQYRVGVCYIKGHGVPRDELQAVTWLTKAAKQGYIDAQAELAVLAYQRYERDCDGFSHLSEVVRDRRLKDLSEKNKPVVQDLTKAAEQQNAHALFFLGHYYSNEKFIPRDSKKAHEFYTMSAEQGYILAQYIVANNYYYGRGVLKDPQKAAYWLTKAAKQGHVEAQYYLGKWHHRDETVKNPKKSVYWFTKAAEQGYPDAEFYLGYFYYHGINVSKWISKANKSGYPFAKKFWDDNELWKY